jgi:imidazolonepropionase-like amidohydrolase
LIDAHSTLGLSGLLNDEHDQEQLERSAPIQPALRAMDAYNAQDRLIAWVRSLGVTTLHTGHAPGELISGQTMIVKTVGNTVDDALLVPARAVACSLVSAARKSGSQSPGPRGKMMAMLRGELIRAQEYQAKLARAAEPPDGGGDPPPRDLHLETLAQVLRGELALLITADRATDIANALRLAREFDIRIWLDSAAEAYLLIEDIQAAGVPVILHPTMTRAVGDTENLSFETAAKLVAAGIPVALQSGYEAYVPKTRVVLFEAARAAAEGLSFEQALSTITIGAARVLGIDQRVGSLEVGKDGDIALYDGDPFEYTTHCVGVVINGQVVSEEIR